ncbi:phosphatidylinositol-3-phosphatase ymr1 [Vermiconidia calcicola]|uniref:Phosphatidylinositol-3-phosphatase ymr1 n=1 Tax=Vermiconidia calcicola TaxID=1690605 RepID=A0ACC3MJI0_9PEZI|nr:phosphatidylinositol-3-phosphatase ymr1 [Vermiconidia calcicola]
MVETPKPDQELRFRNVTLHSLGRQEHGTLYLTKHHLLFSFLPNARKAKHAITTAGSGTDKNEVPQGHHETSMESSRMNSSSTASTASNPSGELRASTELTLENGSARQDGVLNVDGDRSTQREARQKQRPKEIWLPYPLISRCVLRPSHLQGQPVRAQEPTDDPPPPSARDDSELFPPVFGTASYRPSSDSARLAPYSSPARPASPVGQEVQEVPSSDRGRQPAIRIRRKDFQMLALHFHADQLGAPPDETARKAFYILRSRCCVDKPQELHAFHFRPPKEESDAPGHIYDARKEYARMGISGKAADGPGAAWRISDINHDYSYAATYPSVLCVPHDVSDNLLKYGGHFRSRARIPCLAYLHCNGGSITRSSQPMVGVQNKRNPQDERLVSAIFSSHTPPPESPESPSITASLSTVAKSESLPASAGEPDTQGLPLSRSDTALNEKVDEKSTPIRKKVYGSTRRNLIVDARPKINALANRATGGGIEDVSNYAGNGDMTVERVFLNIANIHVMRASLEKVIDSFANSDYIKMKPDSEALRKSGWLGHIAGMLDGAEMIARVVGLGGSHVLIHCSDGWDRTAQVSAMVQLMLDSHYRTFEGFISLIQKDFLSFGHKFRDRNGVEGSEKWFEIENERIAPSRARESNNSDPNSINALGAKALSGAKNWFDKNRGGLFRQQNHSRDSLGDHSPSRTSSPPPNPLLHSPPIPTGKEEKEHKISEKEISPIFHQFLDAVYQMLYQNPDAFEFNEKFLRRMFYHAYACQYGEFLFNTEKDRTHHMNKLPSVWKHFMVRKQEFINPSYIAKLDDPLLFPKRQSLGGEIEVRWWSGLFLKEDEEMNLPRALAPADPTVMTATLGSSVSFDDQALVPEKSETASAPNGTLKETKSTPSLSTTGGSVRDSFSTLSVEDSDVKSAAATERIIPQPNASFEVLPRHDDLAKEPSKVNEAVPMEGNPEMEPPAVGLEGDPLGVTKSISQSGRLDFAAFASQNAYRDR